VVELSVPSGATAAINSSSGALVAIDGTPVKTSLRYYTPIVADNRSQSWGSDNPWSVACPSACVSVPYRCRQTRWHERKQLLAFDIPDAALMLPTSPRQFHRIRLPAAARDSRGIWW